MMAPCNWSGDFSCCQSFWDGLAPGVQTVALALATKVLWALSGRQYGDCPVTVRPCAQKVGPTYRTYGVWSDGYYDSAMGPTWMPYVDASGSWRNCGCGGACSCAPSSVVWLPGPVTSITNVKIGGVVVPAGDYRVDVRAGRFWLVGQNGRVWPECQNLDQPAAGADAFTVTYTRDKPLPAEVPFLVGLLACEFGKLCTNQPCRLSQSAVSVSRDGVSYEILTAENLIKEGMTPIPEINQWVYAVNPHRRTQRARVFSFDMDEYTTTVIP